MIYYIQDRVHIAIHDWKLSINEGCEPPRAQRSESKNRQTTMDVLSPTFAAQVATLITGLHGATHFLAPSGMAKKYGVQDTGLIRVITRRIGAALLSIASMSFSLNVLHEGTLNRAVAFATLPWLVDCVMSTYKGEPKQCGFSPFTNGFMFMINVATFFATFLENHDFGPFAMRAYTLWYFMNALGFIIKPSFGSSAIWNIKGLDEQTGFMFRSVGYPLLALAIYLFLMDYNDMMYPVRAFGYTYIALTAGLAAPILMGGKHGLVELRHRYMAMGSAVLTGIMLRN